MKPVRFGPHAVQKFDDLRKYNVTVTRQQVEDAVRSPDRVEPGSKGRFVATRGFSERLVCELSTATRRMRLRS
jgi:hypothetical protein